MTTKRNRRQITETLREEAMIVKAAQNGPILGPGLKFTPLPPRTMLTATAVVGGERHEVGQLAPDRLDSVAGLMRDFVPCLVIR